LCDHRVKPLLYRITPDNFSIIFGFIFEDDFDRVGPFHYMIVGDDVAAFINDESGALSRLLEFRSALLSEISAEEVFELFVAAKRVSALDYLFYLSISYERLI
jgi:hypothetical protein